MISPQSQIDCWLVLLVFLHFIEKNKDEPFFVYYPMILTHCPFIPTPGHPDYDAKDPGSKTYKGDAKYLTGLDVSWISRYKEEDERYIYLYRYL